MAWGKAKDDLAADKALADQRKVAKVIDRLRTNGQTAAANAVTNGAGRADSPEVLEGRVQAAADNRKGKGGGLSK
ncbi:hypothetical protein ACIA58_05125 [Kribbella sp. NPDC051586]|uniref:hypothetical protein n=1 Tax=Kribbella sp. NPDC051586 TaxID=3364118 RepID=UPI00379DBAB0